MSKIVETIRLDIDAARRQKQSATVTRLSTLLGEIQRLPNKQITDEDAVRVVKKTIVSLNDFATNVPSLAHQVQEEIELLNKYMPKAFTPAEIEATVIDFMNDNLGAPLKDLMVFLSATEKQSSKSIDKKYASEFFKQCKG